MATYDWIQASCLAAGGTLVEVGPAQKWNAGRVLYRKTEQLIGQAKEALEHQVSTATGVVYGLAAADEWLAALVGNSAFVTSVVAGAPEEEYKELAELISTVGCV